MKLKISVTARDIVLGARHNSVFCPIARAAGRALRTADPKNFMATVGPGSLFFSVHSTVNGKTAYKLGWAPLPTKAKSFVAKFDKGCKTLKPFSFTVDITELKNK